MRSRQLVDVKKDDGFAALHLASLNGHVQVGSYFRARFSLNHSLFVLFLLCFCFFFVFFVFFRWENYYWISGSALWIL